MASSPDASPKGSSPKGSSPQDAGPWDDLALSPMDPPQGLEVEGAFEKRLPHRGALVEYWALRSALFTLDHLPRPLLGPALGGLARLARRVDRRHARAARDFLATVFPGAGPKELEERLLQAYRHLARIAVESEGLSRLVGRRLGDHYRIETCPGLEELLGAGGGCILLTAHVGFWEGIGLPLHALGLRRGVVVGKPPNNIHMARWLQRRREKQGGRLLPRKGAMGGIATALAQGGVALLLLDQRPRHKAITAELFGRPAACDRSAGVLLKRMGVPVLVAGCYLTDTAQQYRLVFQRIIQPAELDGEPVEAILGLVNREIEKLVLRAPEQYFWLHDRYRGMPALGAAAPRAYPGAP